MTDVVTTAQPGAILKELGQLWRTLGQEEQAEHPSPVLRACSMTLLVASSDRRDAAHVGETLALLMHEHPSRAIVLRLHDTAEALLEARVFAQCWMPFGRRQQICCEQIELTAAYQNLSQMPPVVLGIVVPDLPVVMWVRQPELLERPEFRQLLPLVDKVIVDPQNSDPLTIVRQLRQLQQGGLLVADLSWARVTRWRETIAQIFDQPAQLARVGDIREAVLTQRAGATPLDAYYMAGWLRYALGRSLPVRLQTGEATGAEPLQRVELRGAAVAYIVALQGGCSVEVSSGEQQCRTVFPVMSEYELLRQELGLLHRDAVYAAALAATEEFGEEQR